MLYYVHIATLEIAIISKYLCWPSCLDREKSCGVRGQRVSLLCTHIMYVYIIYRMDAVVAFGLDSQCRFNSGLIKRYEHFSAV